MKFIEFPIVNYLNCEFFFIGDYVFARERSSRDWTEFRFSEDVRAIDGKEHGVEVLLWNGKKDLITGGPSLPLMYAISLATTEGSHEL